MEKQTKVANGFIGGALLVDRALTFWTVTGWESEAAMKAYRGSGAHGKAMPKLPKWCDEAVTAHWTQDSGELPAWEEAHRKMVETGRLSRVEHPTANHINRIIPLPRTSLARRLEPAARSA